jgi:hypothetical protein
MGDPLLSFSEKLRVAPPVVQVEVIPGTDLEAAVPVDRLLTHMEKFFSDAMLLADFRDCVLVCAGTPEDRDILEMYFRLRRKYKSFQKGSYTHNNHRDIAAKFKRWRVEYGQELGRTVCEVCAEPFPSEGSHQPRADRRYCSDRCGATARRARNGLPND